MKNFYGALNQGFYMWSFSTKKSITGQHQENQVQHLAQISSGAPESHEIKSIS
ncbi:MAG: hypothetical protein ABIR06_09590 [Cyclobacteriaceae bacterium]